MSKKQMRTGNSGGDCDMRLKFLVLAIMLSMWTIQGANTTNCTILVGTHEVRFNSSLPLLFDYLQHDTIYSPTNYLGLYPFEGGHYNSSDTHLMSLDHQNLILRFVVNDFEKPVPIYVEQLETAILNDYQNVLSEVKANHNINDGTNTSGYSIAVHSGDAVLTPFYKNEWTGTAIIWPSEKVEIVITGILPNEEAWSEIMKSIVLVK